VGADDSDSEAEDLPSSLAHRAATFRSESLPSRKAKAYFYGAKG